MKMALNDKRPTKAKGSPAPKMKKTPGSKEKLMKMKGKKK